MAREARHEDCVNVPEELRLFGEGTVNMEGWVLAVFALLAGLTSCGLAASVFELVLEREPRFAEPFVSPENLPRTAAVLLLVGPFMLGNDALAAFRAGLVSRLALGGCAAAALAWAAASGAVVLAGVSSLARLAI